MKATVYKGNVKGEITPPSSKSYGHRLLIAAAFSSAPSKFVISDFSDDINATISALCEVGAQIKTEKNTVTVIPIKDIPVSATINAKESGSTLRFMLPILCALGVEAKIYGEGKLLSRPIEPLLNLLRSHGIKAKVCADFISVKGKLSQGNYSVSGEISSQFITGLLFALSLLPGESSLSVLGKTVSKNYIDMTVEILRLYGISIKKEDNVFLIPKKKQFTSRKNNICEGDWSSAAFMAVLGALKGELTLNGLNLYSLQADRKILDILTLMGADLKSDSSVTLKESKLIGVDLNMTDCPDIIPIVAVACACAEGISHIEGVDRLKDKESDRLSAIIKMLNAFKIKTEYSLNVLTIYGGKPKGAVINLEPDHRTVMSACVMGLIAEGKTEVENAQAVNKSYPSFFKDIKSVGGKIECTD